MKQIRGKKFSVDQLKSLKERFTEFRTRKPRPSAEEVSEFLTIVSEEMGFSMKSVRKNWENPGLLDDKISRYESTLGEVFWWRTDNPDILFVREMGRLLCWPPNMVYKRYESLFVSVKRGSANVEPVAPLLTGRTLRNQLYCLFEPTGLMQVKEILADEGLRAVARNHLKKWPAGTLGIHCVRITWTQPDPNVEIRRGRWPNSCIKEGLLILLADRASSKVLISKRIKFKVMETGYSGDQLSCCIGALLEEAKITPKLVRVSSRLEHGVAVPTVDLPDIFDVVSGNPVAMEADAPTLDMGPIRIPGGYKDLSAVEKRIYRYVNRRKQAKPSKRQVTG